MSLDVHWLAEDGDPDRLAALEGDLLAGIEPAVLELRRRTAVYLDECGDTRLAPNHAKLLATEIRGLGPAVAARAAPFLAVLDRAAAEGRWLLFSGD